MTCCFFQPLLAFWPVHPRVGKVSENDAGLLARHGDAPPVEGLMDDNPYP